MTETEIQKAPILICGMHRSGTSMVAQVLARTGLYLGEDDDLMDAHPEDNPDGYWEFNKIINFADNLLGKIGGSWDNLSPLKTNSWLQDINLEEEQKAALEILDPLKSKVRVWGWKDPRATVMLPFWQSIYPDIKVIIVLRNPLEVAYSLSKRYQTHLDFARGLELWQEYHEILTRDMRETNSIVTHYEAMIFAPEKELERITNFINLTPSAQERIEALKAIKTDLYRGVATEELLYQYKDLPAGMLELYEKYSALAGVNFDNIEQYRPSNYERTQLALNRTISTSVKTFDHYHQLLQSLKTQVREQTNSINKIKMSGEKKEALIQNLSAQIKEQENAIENLSVQLHDSKKNAHNLITQLNDSEKAVQNLTSQIREQDQNIQGLVTRLQESEQEILFYALSKSWRYTRPLRKLKKLLVRK